MGRELAASWEEAQPGAVHLGLEMSVEGRVPGEASRTAVHGECSGGVLALCLESGSQCGRSVSGSLPWRVGHLEHRLQRGELYPGGFLAPRAWPCLRTPGQQHRTPETPPSESLILSSSACGGRWHLLVPMGEPRTEIVSPACYFWVSCPGKAVRISGSHSVTRRTRSPWRR